MKRGLIIFVLLLLSISLISAAIMHPASSVLVNVDGTPRNLDAGASYFTGTHNYTSVSNLMMGQHDASQIWVSVKDGEKNLIDALKSTNKLCPKSPPTTPLGPSDKTKAYHLATDIQLASGENLQQAINDIKFCCTPTTCCTPHATTTCYDNDVYWYNSCGVREELKQDCGNNYCDAWGGWYCRSSTLLERKRTCYDVGCSSGVCYSNPYNEYGLSHCLSGEECKSGKCVAEGGKVICTELYTAGILDEETYKMDVEYASKHFSKEALRGYQAWAIPVVRAMRKSPEEAERIVVPLVKSFMEEIAYRTGKRETGNEVGKLFLDEGVPLFERIGVYIDEPDWRSLFNQNWLLMNIFRKDNFLLYYIYNYKPPLQKENKYNELVENYFTEEKVREMFYDAERRGGNSRIAVAKALIENLEDAVEEIESLIKST